MYIECASTVNYSTLFSIPIAVIEVLLRVRRRIEYTYARVLQLQRMPGYELAKADPDGLAPKHICNI